MTLQSKRELIQAIRRVYRKASKRQESQHLDHLELVTELKRNYLNRLLLVGYKERRKRPGRQSRYARDPEFMTALKRIWVATRYLSGKLLKRSIRFYVETYQFHYGALPAEVSEKLLKISPATIDRTFSPRSESLGTEFLNSKVYKFCVEEGIPLTRSRPYKKNDNAHVEQKNWMTARDALGFMRMENPDIVPVANDLYKNDYRVFKNYFTPCFKLKEKLKVGSRYKRIYDDPKTPLERVLESDYIAEEQKQKLKQEQQSLDPFTLSKNIERKILRVKALAKVSFEEWQLLPDSQKLLTFLFQ